MGTCIKINVMKQFLIRIGIYAILILICFIVLDLVISNMFRRYISKDSITYAGWNHVFDDTTNFDVVVCGNSRAMVQYNPQLIDTLLNVNSINLGINGSAINRQMVKFKYFMNNHKSPKLLIQNIDIFTMKKTIGFEREQYYPYFYNRIFVDDIDIDECYSYQEKNIPFWRYLGMYHILKDLKTDSIYKGYKIEPRLWNASELDKITEIKIEINNTMVERYRNFLQECINREILVLFVHAPYYHEVLKKCSNIEEYTTLWQDLSKEFSIPILDYTLDSICYDTTYFFNGTHLNSIGADRFTMNLAYDIDSLGLLK